MLIILHEQMSMFSFLLTVCFLYENIILRYHISCFGENWKGGGQMILQGYYKSTTVNVIHLTMYSF